VTSESEQTRVEGMVKQLVGHPFSQNLQFRIVTFEQFERTECCRRATACANLKKQYMGSKSGEILGLYALIDDKGIEQAIIIPTGEEYDLDAMKHELGHVASARTLRGKELRAAYESERDGLDIVIGTQYSRSLAERAVSLPEDHEIEGTIIRSLDNKQAREHLEHALDVYGNGLRIIEGSDISPEDWKRAQTALHSFQYSLASRSFAKIAQEHSFSELAWKFLELSEKFANTYLLPRVSIERFFDLMLQESPREYVVECCSTLKRIVLFARQLDPRLL
jgi:hypothetical protein